MLTYDDVVELASHIEHKIIDNVCGEDNENMQYTIPYDKNCKVDGLEVSPPNSFDLHDTIREILLKQFNIEDEFE